MGLELLSKKREREYLHSLSAPFREKLYIFLVSCLCLMLAVIFLACIGAYIYELRIKRRCKRDRMEKRRHLWPMSYDLPPV